jgi:hypothetical protein
LPRGSGGRLPWTYDVDVNLGYRFQIDKDKSIGLSLDIFNLFNFQEVTSVDENYTHSFIGTQTAGGPLGATTINAGNGAPIRPINLQDKNINFLSPTSFQTPRQFRLGIRGTF